MDEPNNELSLCQLFDATVDLLIWVKNIYHMLKPCLEIKN
jgi:hypothetical protein